MKMMNRSEEIRYELIIPPVNQLFNKEKNYESVLSAFI